MSTEPKSHRPPVNELLAHATRAILRWRAVILVVVLVLDSFLAWQVFTRIQVDNSQEKFLVAGSVARSSMAELHEAFGNDDLFLLLIEGDVFSTTYLERLRALHEEVERIDVALSDKSAPVDDPEGIVDALQDDEWEGLEDDEGWGDEAHGSVIEEVTSLLNVRETKWHGGGLRVEGLIEKTPPADELPALRKRVLADNKLVGHVVAPAGTHSVLIAQPANLHQNDLDKVYAEMNRLRDAHDTEGFRVQVGGPPALFSALNEVALKEMGYLGIYVSIMLIIALGLIFRHPIGTLGPLICVGQAVLWTLGLLVMLEMTLTTVTTILGAFLLCVGVGGTIHVQSVYRDLRATGTPNEEAIVEAVAGTGVPVFLTSVTTGVGLLSLMAASLPPIQELGGLSAFGVMCAFVLTLVFLPVALSFNQNSLLGRGDNVGTSWLDRLVEACGALSLARGGRMATLALMAVVTIGSITFATQIEVSHDSRKHLPPAHAVRGALTDLDEHVGGTNTMSLLVEAHAGEDIRQRDLLRGLEKLEQHLLAYRDPWDGEAIVSSATSVLDVVREGWRALNGGEQAFYAVPDSDRGVIDTVTLFSNAGPRALRRFVTLDHDKTLMTLRVEWRDSAAYRPLVDHMHEGIDEYIGDLAAVRPTGAVLNHHAIETELLSDMFRSFGMASLVITVLMVFLLGDLKLGLVAMVPNLLPIAVLLGFMGAFGVHLDVQNLLLASIIIGIAVDDTIHFLHQFKSHHQRFGDVDRAIDHAFSHAGRAIVVTSCVLIAGFLILQLGQMENTGVFGRLAAGAVFAALVADLVFVPALLRTIYPQSAQAPSEGRLAR